MSFNANSWDGAENGVDIVADRSSLLFIGMSAVWGACIAFAAARLVLTLTTGQITPWWANAAGAVTIPLLFVWYRRRPRERTAVAAHGTALVATLALLAPVAYGMSSTMWWLGLVGFAMVLLGRRREALIWGVAIPLLVAAAILVEPFVQLEGASGESRVEHGLARLVFVAILIGMAAAFRRVAERRASALHDSEARYRLLFRSAPVGVLHYDTDLRVTTSNDYLHTFFSVPQQRLVGLDLTAFADQRALPAFKEALAGRTGSYEGPYSTTAADEIAVSIRTAPLRSTGNAIAGAIAIIEDYTDRKRMEEELRRSRDELEIRVRERTDELWRLNRVLRTLGECNEAVIRASDETVLLNEVCRIIGENGNHGLVWVCLAEEADPATLLVAAHWGQNGDLLERCVAEGQRHADSPAVRALRSGELERIRPESDGETCASWYEEMRRAGFASGVAVPLRSARRSLGVLVVLDTQIGVFDAAGSKLLQNLADDLAFGVSALRTRAAREVAERSLRRSEERFRTLVENQGEGVAIVDRSGTVVYANPAANGIFGLVDSGLATRDLSEFVSPDGITVFLTPPSGPEGAGGSRETSIRRTDGKVRDLLVTTTPRRREDDTASGVLCVFRDVTEMRCLEEQLRHVQKMDAIGRLAGGVAHDFNNLLQAVLSEVQLIPHVVDSRDRLCDIAGEIEQQIRRGAGLARQLLLFSRRETSVPEQRDLNEVIGGQATFLRRLLRENISLRLELFPEPLPVLIDPGQIDQVLMNLVVNSFDVLPGGGEIVIASGRAGDEAVWVTVEDNGPGVPMEFRDKIFEPFFTTKPAGKSEGLGLAVVLGIVTLHQGSIDVRDREGGGSVFTVTLPRATLEESGRTSESISPANPLNEAHGERVLLVEDEPAARDALAELLATLGYEVQAAASAEEALLLPEQPEFDVLLTDVVLPGIPGTALATELQKRWPALSVIVMSGYTEDEVVRRTAGSRELSFLQKPFDMVTLAAQLRAVLDH